MLQESMNMRGLKSYAVLYDDIRWFTDMYCSMGSCFRNDILLYKLYHVQYLIFSMWCTV